MRFNTVARRGFSTTRPQLASPYHYPEGPRSNIPFNPMTKFFAVRYWGFMGTTTAKIGWDWADCIQLLDSARLSLSLVRGDIQIEMQKLAH